MPRAPTTTDVFNAIAEPRRREIIDVLARQGALAVGAIVLALGLPQPTVSKHLGVLRAVGVVAVSSIGRQRLYSLEPHMLKSIHDWVQRYEPLWRLQLQSIKERAERRARERASTTPPKAS